MSLVLPYNFVWITDIHTPEGGTPVDRVFWDEYRRYSKWWEHLEAALIMAKTLDDAGTPISFVANTGDLTDSGADDNEQALIDQATAVSGSVWPGPYLEAIGNHDFVYFSGKWAAEWFPNLLGRTAHDHEWTDDDDENDNVAGKAYSVDINGFHIVVLYSYIESHTMTAGQLAWLAADLAAHDMPTIVFSHTWFSGVGGTKGNNANPADVRAVFEAAGTVQAHFGAHNHKAHAPVLINDIWYFQGWGSVDAPAEADNSYHLVQILPFAYKGTNRYRANIKVTVYGNHSEHGTQYSKDYERFLVAGA